MYYKLDEKEIKKIKKAENLTNTDYDLEGDFIPVDALMECIENLLLHIEWMEENGFDD